MKLVVDRTQTCSGSVFSKVLVEKFGFAEIWQLFEVRYFWVRSTTNCWTWARCLDFRAKSQEEEGCLELNLVQIFQFHIRVLDFDAKPLWRDDYGQLDDAKFRNSLLVQ